MLISYTVDLCSFPFLRYKIPLSKYVLSRHVILLEIRVCIGNTYALSESEWDSNNNKYLIATLHYIRDPHKNKWMHGISKLHSMPYTYIHSSKVRM
jgi:hypothetical protein